MIIDVLRNISMVLVCLDYTIEQIDITCIVVTRSNSFSDLFKIETCGIRVTKDVSHDIQHFYCVIPRKIHITLEREH